METTTEVTVIDRSLEVIATGGQILLSNTTRVDKALQIGDKILSDIEAAGGILTPELDTRCLNYLANCSKAIKEMNDARKPITQMMDKLKGLFTEQEGRLDNKKPESKAATIQKYRDAYALKLQQEEDERRRQAEIEAKKNDEAINLRAECERRLQDYFLGHLTSKKQWLNTVFNSIGNILEDFDKDAEAFKTAVLVYDWQHFSDFSFTYPAIHHTSVEVKNIVINVTAGRFEEFAAQYNTEIAEFHQQLITYLPSRKNELESLAKADDEQRKQIEAEQQRRQQEDEARIQREQEESRKAAEQQIELKASQDSVNNLFDKEAAIAVSVPKPEARNGFDIEILHPGAWPLIFQLWYTEEGSKLPIDKSEKVTLKAMKTFCESYAKKYGTKIESQYLKYNSAVKAINRKTA